MEWCGRLRDRLARPATRAHSTYGSVFDQPFSASHKSYLNYCPAWRYLPTQGVIALLQRFSPNSAVRMAAIFVGNIPRSVVEAIKSYFVE